MPKLMTKSPSTALIPKLPLPASIGSVDAVRALGLAALLTLTALALPALAQEPALVRVETVRHENMTQTVPVLGRIVSRRSGEVAARIAGPIDEMLVEVGDQVSKGQLLARLSPETLRADRELAASELGEAESALKTAQSETDLAREELKRTEGLRRSAAFSLARYNDAKIKLAIAEAKVRSAESRIATKKAALALKEIDLDYTRIVAPYDAVIVEREMEAGEYVQAGDPLVKLIGTKDLEIEADVPDLRIAALRPGLEVGVLLDDGSRHTAVVRAVLPSVNPLTRTRATRFVPRFNEVHRPLADAQSVTVEIPAAESKPVLSVHKDAVIKRPNGDLVFAVVDGKAVPRTVRLGQAVGSRLQVLDGLKDGDTVVIRGNERLQPGQPVRVEKGST